MNRKNSHIRTPVRRELAEQYLLVSLVGFGGSVILTRLFLELTGYPRIETGELHLAHVLWGGLFLFVAAMLPLIFANRWALFWSALFSGIGFGLFIDEVGKFITQSNDYFYPPAAPIIYAIFLIMVVVYIQTRKPPRATPREELYRALHTIEELLDNDLDETEKAQLQDRLAQITKASTDPNLRGLAQSLSAFLDYEHLSIVSPRKTFFTNASQKFFRTMEKIFTRTRLRITLIIGLGAIGLYSVVSLVNLGIFSVQAIQGTASSLFYDLEAYPFISSPIWIVTRVAVQGLVGTVSLVAAIFFAIRKEQRAVIFSILGLTVSLTVVNILIFYLDQFSAAIGALVEFTLLLGVLSYRRRFLKPQTTIITHDDQPGEVPVNPA